MKRCSKSCLSRACDRCGLTCSIWLVAVNMARKTNEYSRHINLTPCKQTGMTQLSECRFNIWCPNLWVHQMFDAFQQGTGSIKIKLGCCQLFGCKSTFWGNSPTPKSFLRCMKENICYILIYILASKYLFPSGSTSGLSIYLLPFWTKGTHTHLHLKTFSVCSPTDPSKDVQWALPGDKKWSAAERPRRLWSLKCSLFVQDGAESSFSRRTALVSWTEK